MTFAELLGKELQAAWVKSAQTTVESGWVAVAQRALDLGDSGLVDEDSLRHSIEVRGIRRHKEHAPAWRSGWVKWTDPMPWEFEVCVESGLLVADRDDPGNISVHITDEGKAFADEHLPE